MKRIHRIWRDRILLEPEWEHAKIRQFCKAIYGLSVHDEAGGFRTALDQTEAGELCDLFNEKYPGRFDGPRVTEEQAQIGRHWLATTGVRYGLNRDVNYSEIGYFLFTGPKTVSMGPGRPYVTPAYVAVWPGSGQLLEYWATPWQSVSDFVYSWEHL